MPNINKVLNEEIRRLARREVRSSLSPLQDKNRALRKTVSELQTRVRQLERANKRLASQTVQPTAVAAASDASADTDEDRVRITAKGIRSLRQKWNMTAAEFAEMLGVSQLTVYNWEKKEGPIRMRQRPRSAYLGLRDLGAREARRRLEEMQGGQAPDTNGDPGSAGFKSKK
jgi:DNA-binding transcriptional regulator YiaG